MALNFPKTPLTNDVWIDLNDVHWEFNGEMWRRLIPIAETVDGLVPEGGETGQRLSKKTETNYDTEWSYINIDAGIF